MHALYRFDTETYKLTLVWKINPQKILISFQVEMHTVQTQLCLY